MADSDFARSAEEVDVSMIDHRFVGRLTRRWLVVIAALALVLIMGGAGQTPQAQAQEVERYIVKVINRQATICLNETVAYLVQILVSQQVGVVPDNLARTPLRPGVTVAAKSSNENVGVFTRDIIPVLSSGADPDSYRANLVQFTFTAKKVGTTTLEFGANVVGSRAEHDSIVVKVVAACHYKVTVFSYAFSALSAGNTIGLLGIINDADLILDDDGIYRGMAEVDWIPNIFIAGCGHTDSLPDSGVQMRGGVDAQSGNLMVNVTYEPATLTEVHCTGQTVNTLSPDPIDVTVSPIGGTSVKPHAIQARGVIYGSAKVFVLPVRTGGK
jgi:hypothetical protein